MISKRMLSMLVLASSLSACASPETRVRTGLINAGLSPRMAACMAERMVDRLSLSQLRRIGDLPRAAHAGSTDELLHRMRALEDPEIVRVTAGAAAHCELQRLIG